MQSFLALYRGQSIGSASLVAVSADPEIVKDFTKRMLDGDMPADPPTRAVEEGRRHALRLVQEEAEGEKE